MRIKIAILDKDSDYLERLTSNFGVRYAKELEIYSFTDLQTAMKTLDSKRVDVFLSTDVFNVNTKDLPKRCGFAYFVDDPDTESINDIPTVCKFQKAELIYKQILGIYAEHSASIMGRKAATNASTMLVFTSPCGGVGTSTVAASCAVEAATKGKNVLYLNFEIFGAADAFFYAEGTLGMSEIIYALKSRKSNLPLKLESCVKRDPSGVYFFSSTGLALDNMELTSDEIGDLLDAIEMSTNFDVVVLDLPYRLSKSDIKLMDKANAIILVGDGSEISNMKIKRGFEALSAVEQGMDETITLRTSLVYDKFSSRTGVLIDEIEIPSIGGIPRYENATTEQIVSKIVEKNLFDQFFNQEIN